MLRFYQYHYIWCTVCKFSNFGQHVKEICSPCKGSLDPGVHGKGHHLWCLCQIIHYSSKIHSNTVSLFVGSKEKFDVSGRATYLSACADCGVIPASYYLRHMKQTSLEMHHHGLGEKGARALAIALVVSYLVCHLFNSYCTSGL